MLLFFSILLAFCIQSTTISESVRL